LVQRGHTTLMIDCGFSLREVQRRLARLDLVPGDIAAILVTHEHSDHAKGVESLARTYAIPVYMSHGTFLATKWQRLPHYRLIKPSQSFSVGDIHVQTVAVPHDSREATQFVFRHADKVLGVLTDLGSITPHVIEHYRHCNGLVLEFNHCPDMLAKGPYPPALQRRVGGNWGHLSNDQAASLLQHVDYDQLQHVVVSHISEKNNAPERVVASMQRVLPNLEKVVVADQENGFAWLSLT
jgi:phosphoribosyl 1,2-cyclic phosphodiesterase